MTDWMFGAGAVSPLSQPQEAILREQHSALAVLDTEYMHAAASVVRFLFILSLCTLT